MSYSFLHMSTKLFCPSCGTQNSTDQSFCRACGLSLQKAAESLVDHAAGNAPAKPGASSALDWFGTIVFTGLAIVVAAAIIGLLYAVVTRMITSGSNPLVGVLLAAFIVFAALALAYVFWRESLADTERRRENNGAPPAMGPGDRPLALEDRPFEPVPSVVENTTQRLKITNRLPRNE